MNQHVLKKYGIEFKRRSDGDPDIDGDWLATYIFIFRDSEDLADFIHDLDLAIHHQFDEIEDPDYSEELGSYWFAEIRSTGFAIWQEGVPMIIIPLEDMKDLLVSWKAFVEG